MTDVVYLYPKTSCPCADCSLEFPQETGIKSSTAVRGCFASPYFDCNPRVVLGTAVRPEPQSSQFGPSSSHKLYSLNPEMYTDKLAEGFDRVTCENGKGQSEPVAPSCPSTSYYSRDPRQFDSPRAQVLPLDTVPIDGDVRLKNIYNKNLEGYRTGFKTYESINDGQILYYIDQSIQDAFYKPVFSEPALETKVLFQDPMGSMKPEYNRTPLLNTANPTTTTVKKYPYCLSWLQDSCSQREDLMALQQRKHNQEKWSARWT